MVLNYPAFAMNWTMEERKKRLFSFNAQRKKNKQPTFNTDPTLPFSHVSLIPGGGGAEQGSYQRTKAYHDTEQLYDLSSDPKEKVNLAKAPEQRKRLVLMRQKLSAQLIKLNDTFPIPTN